ncbi:MAG: LuxR C-terminal-related transcriptional regulator [Gemmatimonadota bacterium]
MTGSLQRGRESFERQAWEDTYAQLSDADRERPLDPEDLQRVALAANLLGMDAASAEMLTRAHNAFLDRGDAARAARCAFWIAMPLMLRGETAQGGGWIARGWRVLEDGQNDCVERGYLLLAGSARRLFEGDPAAAETTFVQAVGIGDRFRDADLTTLARQGHGRALIRLGQTARGMALLDEAMAAIAAGEVSPVVIGAVYCSVIEACHEVFDLRRAREWTDALSEWCARQPETFPYRGRCLIHRAELMQLGGAWPGAAEEAGRAHDRLSRPPVDRAIGAAAYQLGELHRLRGDFKKAEATYREAGRYGRDPQPGLALLRSSQGKTPAAWAAISRAMEEVREGCVRPRLLPAYVEIALATGEVAAARTAANELAVVAARYDSPLLRAASAHAAGAVLLAEGEPRAALAELRTAAGIWRDLETPYDGARSGVLIAIALRTLGDADSADLELDAARQAFEQLGAGPDLAILTALARPASDARSAKLTAREVQVLRLVAAGKTNRAIAATLGISDKTVARHLSNMFVKLDLSSRAAATAYAYQNGLVRDPT